ncbi:Hypothetical protein, putative [Bodo saltans]|uniref:C-CAP/cofactor C-like domain-containing protein n=1 Tax=Bodo saltans TaxID=75058 RepID=A0A0S4IT33_BODSA|nr:Hypothetical protein, putative [Bodo saltans]|eukprot:CUF74130.1 Hypothetical protein, putative [Bodo saltans]
MIVDSVEDVYISDCENVTIVVIGAKGAINVSNVRHAKLFLAGAYVMLSDCSHCEVHAFALKGAMIEGCERIIVFPMFASFPGIDGVIQQMAEANGVEGEVSGADNLFLTPRVQVQNNNGVDVHQHPQLLVSLDAPELGECPSALFSQQTAPAGAKLIPVNFSSSLFEGHHLALESGSVLERSSDVVVQISYMIDASILRTAGMLCPGRKPALPTDPSTNLIISHVHTGVIHVADAVAHLTIVGCTGPLDIVVAAAQQVTVSDCTGITVQVACFGFTAAHCQNCHFALHVNTEPKIEQRCENVLFSALNITCLGYEDVLDRASVQQHLNLYDHPVDADTAAIGPSIATSTGISVESLGATLRVSDAASARKLLDRRCFIAPPLPATCVGTAEAPFLGALEDRVEKDQSRPNVYLTLFEALSTVASSRLDEITDESLLVGDRRHSISHSDEGREDDDRPQRSSARLGQRSRKHDHYDSSSDDEEDNDEEVNESGHSSNTTSPRKVASQAQQSPAQSDSDSSPVKGAAKSVVPPQHKAPAQPAFVGSMSAANRDDSSSSSSSDADDDSEKHQSPNRYKKKIGL